MCCLAEVTESKVLKVLKKNALIGYRGWYIKKGLLYPLNQYTEIALVPKKVNKAVLTTKQLELETEDGFYSYNSYDNNYYNNYYNYNSYYNNNNNYNYYYTIYYYNNYNYNYYYNNYVAGTCIQYGQVVKHKLGYRSTILYPKTLILLTPKEGLASNVQNFLEDFNSKVKACAKNYGIKTINHVDFK